MITCLTKRIAPDKFSLIKNKKGWSATKFIRNWNRLTHGSHARKTSRDCGSFSSFLIYFNERLLKYVRNVEVLIHERLHYICQTPGEKGKITPSSFNIWEVSTLNENLNFGILKSPTFTFVKAFVEACGVVTRIQKLPFQPKLANHLLHLEEKCKVKIVFITHATE